MKDELVPITELNERSRWDLIAQMKDFSEILYEIEDALLYCLFFEFSNSLKVGIGKRDPKMLQTQFDGNRTTCSEIVHKYKKMLSEGTEFDPVFVCADNFVDGGHRVVAYILAERDEIPTINLAPLYNIDWQDWLDSEE